MALTSAGLKCVADSLIIAQSQCLLLQSHQELPKLCLGPIRSNSQGQLSLPLERGRCDPDPEPADGQERKRDGNEHAKETPPNSCSQKTLHSEEVISLRYR